MSDTGYHDADDSSQVPVVSRIAALNLFGLHSVILRLALR